MEQFTRTFKFKDLLPDFDTFIRKYNEFAPESLNDDSDINGMRTAYILIFAKFCQSSVAFDRPNDFYRQFYSILWDEFEYFNSKLILIKQLHRVSPSDLITEYETITNVAANNNEVVDSPLTEVIPYISTQSSSTSKSNKINAIVRGIQAFRSNEGKYFVDKFKNLFLSIFPNYGIWYKGDE